MELPNLDGGLEVSASTSCRYCVVLKPAEQTPVSIMFLMDIIESLPDGVVNIDGFGVEVGSHCLIPRVQIAFTGETTTGRLSCSSI